MSAMGEHSEAMLDDLLAQFELAVIEHSRNGGEQTREALVAARFAIKNYVENALHSQLLLG
jgi:hypothetical protein